VLIIALSFPTDLKRLLRSEKPFPFLLNMAKHWKRTGTKNSLVRIPRRAQVENNITCNAALLTPKQRRKSATK
jgi:hypothetical protein